MSDKGNSRSATRGSDDNELFLWGPTFFLFIVSAVSLIGIIVFYVYVQKFGITQSSKQDVWGQFGDYFGGLMNPIVAFAALILLVVSLWLQAREIKGALNSLGKANFEASLWQLIRLHREFSANMVTSTPTVAEVRGRACFPLFRHRLETLTREAVAGNTVDKRSEAERVYEHFLRDYEGDIAHYFRLLERILTLIQRAPPTHQDDELVYVDTIRATLSVDEQVLLYFFNVSNASPEFKKLIEDYGLLRELRCEAFPRNQFGDLDYQPSAFEHLPPGNLRSTATRP